MVRFLKMQRVVMVFSLTCFTSAGFCVLSASAPAHAQKESPATNHEGKEKDNDRPLPADAVKNAVLWHDPGNIAGLDLFYGQGGKDHQPEAPFTFVKEDRNGTNPKMDVRDANGKKWRVKEGEEARPEVVASRLLWAIGYGANDDYLVHAGSVSGVVLKRGSNELKLGTLADVRFSRKPGGQNKVGTWEWRTNPFTGTRELNGLRVMMAVMNNWDLKDENNSVYADTKTGSQLFLVNDVGATFGANGLGWTRAGAKGNVESFRDSKFIKRLTDTEIDFSTPKRPTGILIASAGTTLKSYAMRSGLDWIGHNIPRQDARWAGSLLSQLTHAQLVDAFRAGNFPADAIDTYVSIVESRIAELKQL
ncbi:MAG: hypothetical protein ACRYF4_12390 [Janthinobacterium lividum]